jgi:hypothetical protein
MPTTKRPARQREGAPPVSENPKLPSMGEGEVRPEPIAGKIRMMPETPVPAKGGQNVMHPTASIKAEAAAGELPSQEPAQPAKSAKPSEGYIRLRVRVENGKMSVVDSHDVEGPLIESEGVHAGYAYEVSVGSKRLHSGSIPDLSVVRSFPNPEGPPEERGHHITELSTYDFHVRVPRKKISASMLPKTEIALYRVKEPAQAKPLGARLLSTTFERELREVSRLKGIPAKVLTGRGR